MYEVKYDVSKNRMQMRVEGFITKEEAVKYRMACEEVYKKVKPNFTFLVDLRNLKTLPQESIDEIQKVRFSSVKHGAYKGATVLKDTIVRMQTKRTANQIDGFNEDYFTDINEAEIYLEQK